MVLLSLQAKRSLAWGPAEPSGRLENVLSKGRLLQAETTGSLRDRYGKISRFSQRLEAATEAATHVCSDSDHERCSHSEEQQLLGQTALGLQVTPKGRMMQATLIQN